MTATMRIDLTFFWCLLLSFAVSKPMRYVYNASTIYTMQNLMPSIDAICIDLYSGKFVALGESEQVLSDCLNISENGDIEKLNINGNVVIPGLIDSHAHLFGEAQRLSMADLSTAQSMNDIINIIQTYIKINGIPKNNWVMNSIICAFCFFFFAHFRSFFARFFYAFSQKKN